LHDAVMGEQLGIPSTGVMTSEFVSAAELMSAVLGADGFEFVVIEHPIASATPAQLAARAATAASDCARVLTGAAR
jgi:hypothetical protein